MGTISIVSIQTLQTVKDVFVTTSELVDLLIQRQEEKLNLKEQSEFMVSQKELAENERKQ